MGLEKIYVGWAMSTRWTDPPMMLMYLQLGVVPAITFLTAWLTLNGHFTFVPVLLGGCWAYWNFILHAKQPCDSDKYLEWTDADLKSTWQGYKVPIS